MTIDFKFWLFMTILLLFLGGICVQSTVIWFSIGSMINLFLVSCHVGTTFQLVQFLITGIFLSFIFKVLSDKMKRMNPNYESDSMIGKTGKVIEILDKDERLYKVKIKEQIWKAKSDQKLNEGEDVIVLDVNGITLQVKSYQRKKIGGND